MADDKRLAERLITEISVMQETVRSPNVVRLLDFFVQAGKGHNNVVIVTEFVDGNTLLDVICSTMKREGQRGIPEESAWSMFLQLLSASIYLHNNNLVHRQAQMLFIKCMSKGASLAA